MKKFDELADRAVENYGVVTSAEATAMGIALKDVIEWVHSGRLEKVGRGVFRLCRYPYNALCHYAEAVALVGKGAWLYGESVLALHNLAQVNPPCTFVATTKRVRRTLPGWIKIVPRPDETGKDDYEGIPCQNLADVLIESKEHIMRDRLVQAIQEARGRGLLSIEDNRRIKESFGI